MADKKISALTAATTPLAGTEVLPIVQSGTTVKVSAADVTAGRQVALSSAVAGTGLTAIPWVLNANSSFYQAGTISSVIGTSGIVGVGTELARNAYYDGSWKYVGSGSASRLVQTGGQLINYRAISGTANAAVTWIQNLTVDASDNATVNLGNLIIGTAAKGIDFSANTHAAGMTSELLNDYEEGTWTPTDGSGAGLIFTGTSDNCFYTKVGNLVTCVFGLVYPTTANLSGAKLAGLPFTSKATTSSVSGGFITYTNSSLAIAPLVGTNDTGVNLFLNTGNAAGNNQLSTFILRGIITYMV